MATNFTKRLLFQTQSLDIIILETNDFCIFTFYELLNQTSLFLPQVSEMAKNGKIDN